MLWAKRYQVDAAIVIQHCELRKKNRWEFAKNAEATDCSTVAGPKPNWTLLLTQMAVNL